KWQISTAGGYEPRWRTDGRELYYRGDDQKLMAVGIETNPKFAAGLPKALFQSRFETATTRNRYMPSADGSRFLAVGTLGRESITPTTVALNWFAELGR
ncbi:MAG TPA: hypothetical protein VIZ69_06760, partial [Thermoanaerobaculia bacterium]